LHNIERIVAHLLFNIEACVQSYELELIS
jgi:hypothetical protein